MAACATASCFRKDISVSACCVTTFSLAERRFDTRPSSASSSSVRTWACSHSSVSHSISPRSAHSRQPCSLHHALHAIHHHEPAPVACVQSVLRPAPAPADPRSLPAAAPSVAAREHVSTQCTTHAPVGRCGPCVALARALRHFHGTPPPPPPPPPPTHPPPHRHRGRGLWGGTRGDRACRGGPCAGAHQSAQRRAIALMLQSSDHRGQTHVSGRPLP
jgi:hypothetical protein